MGAAASIVIIIISQDADSSGHLCAILLAQIPKGNSLSGLSLLSIPERESFSFPAVTSRCGIVPAAGECAVVRFVVDSKLG
jgi:hypothetical protein